VTDIALGHVDSAPVHRDVAVSLRPEPAPRPNPDPGIDPDPGFNPWSKPAVTRPVPKRRNPRRELYSVEPVRANGLREPCGFLGASPIAGRKR